MPTTDFDCVFILWANNVKTAFLFAFLTLVYTLKDHIGCFWLLNCYHFHGETRCWSSHHPGERFFADFALKFGEIVGDNHAGHFLLDLAVDPHLKTLNVNTLT